MQRLQLHLCQELITTKEIIMRDKKVNQFEIEELEKRFEMGWKKGEG